jgi:hypothetical protein
MRRFSIANNATVAGINHLLSILKEHIPEVINWPLHKVEHSREVINDIIKYCDVDNRMLEFHICPQKGCCVFVADYANNIFCNGCNAQRFRKCEHVGCRGKLTMNIQSYLKIKFPTNVFYIDL